MTTTGASVAVRRPRRMVVASAVALALSLHGCSQPPAPQAPTATSRPRPPALSAALYQSRMDVNDRQIQVQLRNDSDGDVVVERMSLSSSFFDEPMPYRKRGSLLPGGRAVDMPVVLSDPVCDVATAQHAVQVEYRLGDGSTGSVDVRAADERGAIADLRAAECFALEVSQVATLSIRGTPRTVHRNGLLTAELVVDVTAVGDVEGTLRILHMGNTPLLQHVEPATLARLTEGLRLDVRAPDAGTSSFTATLAPSRCDAHAVADDKQGTRFRVLVDLDGKRGHVPLVAADAVKVALYDFVRSSCDGEPR